MSPSLSSPLALVAAVLLPIFSATALLTTTSSTSSSATFPDCDRPFSCGSLRNITYPFTGVNRPEYCGPPQFRLTCRNNTHAELTTTDSVTYRVLDINQSQQTLILATADLWNNTCPQRFVNSTLNSTIFNYRVQNEDLTLVYGCSLLPNYTPYNLFTCVVSGVNFSGAFYLVGPVPIDPILQIITQCSVTITIPVSEEAAVRLTSNQTTLEAALMEGFNVNYTDPYADHCANCSWFGGQCGFDPNSGEPICICGDRSCPLRARTAGTRKLVFGDHVLNSCFGQELL